MNKSSLILKYFQKASQLKVENREYQKSLSSLFAWLVNSDKVTNDKTTKYFPNYICTAKIISREKGIVAGIEELTFLIKQFTHLSFKAQIQDGSSFRKNQQLAGITGNSYELLGLERTILNLLQRLSGIATQTNRLVKLITPIPPASPAGGYTLYPIPYLAATRKTPWMALDKKAVAVGGGITHRLNLADGILTKDNHLLALQKEYRLRTTEEAIRKILETISFKTPLERQLIEIEVKTYHQAFQAVYTFQTLNKNNYLAILFDNFQPREVNLTIKKLAAKFDLSKIIFEASGCISEKNLLQWAKTGVDLISIGSLTHSTHAVDLSLEIN